MRGRWGHVTRYAFIELAGDWFEVDYADWAQRQAIRDDLYFLELNVTPEWH